MINPTTADIRGPSHDSPRPTPAARFRVLRLHATGGLGRVSLAVDEQLNREVALKEIQDRHADDAFSRQRFLREAEITGRLEHPGIVPVYGMDADELGRPRYAMRFIKGESLQDAITRFHDADKGRRDPTERALALRALLTRFVAVCNAVAYAHSRGIIHRDLKPANVMLGDFGETLVVDWGLARALGPGGAEAGPDQAIQVEGETEVTRLGQVVGTLAYLPPEQARGEHDRVGAATDGWALGATLYCLLTGEPPYHGQREEVLEQATRGEVAPARQRNPRVPAALAAVCARAMSPRAEDRYGSAAEMAGEVERWLADEPVSAYREPLTAKALRWGRRHRTVVTAAGALLLASVVGLGAGLAAVNAERSRTAAQRDLAREAEDQANENLDRALAAEKVAKANLREAERAVEESFVVATGDPRLQEVSLRGVRQELLQKMLPYLERFTKQDPDDDKLAARQAVHLFRIGQIDEEMGRNDAAQARYEQARDVLARLSQLHPDVARYQDNLASAWGSLANLQGEKQPREALKSYEQARDLQAKLARAHPKVPAYQAHLARTLNNLGQLRREMGQPREALASFEQARDLQLKLSEEHPKVDRLRLDLGHTWDVLGTIQKEMDRPGEALESYERARAVLGRLVREQPGVSEYQVQFAGICCNLGSLLRDTARPRESLADFDEAVRRLQAVPPPVKDSLVVRVFLRNSHFGRANALLLLGRSREAAADLGQAARLDSGPDRFSFRAQQARALRAAGDHAAAADLAGQLASQKGLPGDALTELGRIQALCAGTALAETARPLPLREKVAGGYADQALALLDRAARAGHFRDAAAREPLRKDPALAALRGRADFAAWLAKVESNP